MQIQNIQSKEILDSRGNPTVCTTLTLADGSVGVGMVPSGASTGSHEAVERRDSDSVRYGGLGVLNVVESIHADLAPALIGKDFNSQYSLDQMLIDLDGSANLGRLGANAVLSISLAYARAAAKSVGQSLYQYFGTYIESHPVQSSFPLPFANVVNGGKHADSGLAVQEFMLVPVGISGYPRQLQALSEISHTLQQILALHALATGVGDEGGFAPRVDSTTQVFDLLLQAISQAGYTSGSEVALALDVAATSFYQPSSQTYLLTPEHETLTAEQLHSMYLSWVEAYPLVSIEDPFHEEDFAAFAKVRTALAARHVGIVGDDLTVTNVGRIEEALAQRSITTLLVKPNQIGTLSGTFDAINLAHKHNIRTIISHRSGETLDDSIADLAVAAGSYGLKAGGMNRGERLAKYNRLSDIYHELYP